MMMKFSLVDATAYPMAVESEPSIPFTPRLQQISTLGGIVNNWA